MFTDENDSIKALAFENNPDAYILFNFLVDKEWTDAGDFQWSWIVQIHSFGR